jgi:tetratricopeptide (TPR) repeat protein
MSLKTGWPFNQPISKDFRLTANLEDTLAGKVSLGHMQWVDAMEMIFEHDKQTDNKEGALKAMEALNLEYQQNEQFCGYSANLNAILKHYDKAAFYYKKLYAISPSDQVIQQIIQLYLNAREPQKALPCIKNLPQAQQPQVEQILAQIIADEQILKTQPGNKQAIDRMVANYKMLGINDSPFKHDN